MFAPGLTIWLTVMLPLLVIVIVIEVFFLLNLRDVLRSVSPQNRAMEPNHVWLNFIPLFGIVWIFVTVIKIRDSARAEFYSRRWAASSDFGYGVGLAYAILSIISWGFLGIAALICYVVYWVRMSELKNQLRQSQPPVGWVTPQSYPGQWGQSGYGGYPGYGASAPQDPPRSCPSCGSAAGSGDIYCRSCGAATQVAPAVSSIVTSGGGLSAADGAAPSEAASAAGCPFCGAAYRPNAQFCSSCGRAAV
jgi:hypothetical protein